MKSAWLEARELADNRGPVNLALMTHDKYLKGPEGDKWREAMDKEMQTLHEFGTWELVDLPSGQKTAWAAQWRWNRL